MRLISKLSDKYPMADPEQWLRFKYPEQKYLDPVLAGRLAALARNQEKVLNIISGFRSSRKQIELFIKSGGYKDASGNWTGGDGYAAKPGTSWHEFRLAADVSDSWAKKIDKDAATMDQKTLLKYGLYKPLTKGNKTSVFEDWHIQPIELLGVAKADRHKWAPEVVIMDVKDFQLAFGLTVDGKIGPQTKGKAAEVKALIDEILAYEKPIVARQKYTHRTENGTHIIEVEPLNLQHVWLRGTDSIPASVLAKTYPDFVNCMFFEGDVVFRLLIQDGQVLSPIMSYDKWPDKGTFIVYKDGSVEVQTIGRDNFDSLDIESIHLAFQGFNLDYEANGSASLRLSMRKEGWGQRDDYIYERNCMRGAIGYNYQTGKAIIVKKETNAAGIRTAIREAGCKGKDNNTVGIGLDSGNSDALVLNGKVINSSSRNQVSILTFK